MTFIDKKLEEERLIPDFSKHNLNSYKTNLEIDPNNLELKNILQYFESNEVYLPLYQEVEFQGGLSIELKIEMLSQSEIDQRIHYRESLFHNHDFFELIYVYKGQSINEIDGEKLVLNRGELMLFNLQSVHKIIVPSRESVVFTLLVAKEVFNKSLIPLLGEEDPLLRFYANSLFNIPGKSFYLFDLNQISKAQYTLLSMVETCMNKRRYAAQLLLLDFEKLMVLLSDELAQHPNHQNLAFQEVEQILWYIFSHYQTITLTQLAKHFGYAPRTLIRYLKKATNQTFSEIVQDYRLLNVCSDLKQTKVPLEQIAEVHGFSERSYMDKVFKKKFGMTPIAYRKKFASKTWLFSFQASQ